MAVRREVSVTVNGKAYTREVEPRLSLVDLRHDHLGLPGTHVGCEQGVCGACTIRLNGTTVRSCLLFAVQANGADVLTVEGLGGVGLHPLQQAFWEHHGLQCGFCTPGMLLAALELLEQHPDPSEEVIRDGIAGNLCMCTGYVNIVKAVQSAARKWEQAGPTLVG